MVFRVTFLLFDSQEKIAFFSSSFARLHSRYDLEKRNISLVFALLPYREEIGNASMELV